METWSLHVAARWGLATVLCAGGVEAVQHPDAVHGSLLDSRLTTLGTGMQSLGF